MSKSISSVLTHRMKSALLLASALFLAGCSTDMAALDDQYVADTHYERYPIKVAKAPMRLEVQTRAGGLQPTQINAISNFARSASQASVTKISVSRPSGGGASAAIAGQVHQLLVQGGVPAGHISQLTYRGSSKGPVVISFTRAIAVTKECGDWSSDLNDSPENRQYSNFGCATQNNIAQMVADPTEFEVPKPTTQAYSSARSFNYHYYAPYWYDQN
jgi:pilus assembly protein CpaD